MHVTRSIFFVCVVGLAGYSITCIAATTASDITVNAAAISGLVEGLVSSSGPVASFVDSNSPGSVADYSALIRWGDGTTSAGTILLESAGRFTVAGSHAYAEEGSYSHSADVTYLPGGFLAIGVGDSSVVVDAPLSLLSAAAVNRYTPGVLLNNVVLAAFSDSNPFGSVIDFTGLIDWGDGTVSPGTLLAEGGQTYALAGSHTYARAGTFAVSLAIQDDGGSSLRTITTETSNAVPEPSSVAVMGLGLVVLGFGRRSKKRATRCG